MLLLSAVPAHGVTNTVGKSMPPDAAPLNQQVFRYLGNEPSSLDISTAIYSTGGFEFLFERLTMLNENNELIPGAADRWQGSKDGKTWTFFLRKGARWSDGHPVTARDFEYSFRRMFDPASANVYAFLYYDVIKGAKAFNQGNTKDPRMVGVRAVDDNTFVIETEHACPYLPYVVSFITSHPVPRWQIEKYGNQWTKGTNAVTNSSYRVAELTPGRRLIFTLNPFYNGPNKGYLERIVMNFIPPGSSPGSASGVAAYENHEIDRLSGVPPGDIARIQADPKLRHELTFYSAFMTWYLYFQTQKPPLNNVKVRQAISHAIDRDMICRVVLKGSGLPAYTMLPPNFPGYTGDKLASVQRFDPALGKKLLAEAGYPGGRGFRTIDLWLRAPTPGVSAVAQAIQGMLRQHLGINLAIRTQEAKVYTDNMYQHAIPMSLISFQYDYPDPNNMLSMIWHSQPKSYSRHDWVNSEFDRLVDTAAAELDPVKRFDLYHQAERILCEQAAGVFVFHDRAADLRKPWVKGIPKNKFGEYAFLQNNTTYLQMYIGKH